MSTSSDSATVRKPQTALILLYDSDDRFLLQHRTSDARVMPDCWGFFGGHVKEGESIEDALMREAYEELRYRLRGPMFLLEQDYRVDQHEGHMYVYVEEFKGDKSELCLLEGQGWGWFASEELEPLKMLAHDIYVVGAASEFVRNLRANKAG